MIQPTLPFGPCDGGEAVRPTDRRTGDAAGSSLRTPGVPVERPHGAAGTGRPAAPGTMEFVRHRRAKRYILRVGADGRVRVTIPQRGSRREAEAFAASQRAWIEKERARTAAERSRPRRELAPELVRELRARASAELPARLLELAAEHGLAVTRVSVRNQLWRWGSCSPNGHICLNWRLVRMPAWVRDYVLVHELMHLKRMDHSPAFWRLVERACPDFRAARAWLRANQHLIADAAASRPTPHARG